MDNLECIGVDEKIILWCIYLCACVYVCLFRGCSESALP